MVMAKKDTVKIVGRAKISKPKVVVDPTHTQLCKAICDYMHIKYPEKLFIHIPNEGKRSPLQGKKLKDEGLLPGVADYFLAHVKRTYENGALTSIIPGVWIEVKTKKDRLSKVQKEFKQRAVAAHYSFFDVNNIDEFMKEIDEYCS
jgi:hypothetical protein